LVEGAQRDSTRAWLIPAAITSSGPGSVPAGRPLSGLVVTVKPFHTVNTPFTVSYLPAYDIEYQMADGVMPPMSCRLAG
jgi:hypothetical protein